MIDHDRLEFMMIFKTECPQALPELIQAIESWNYNRQFRFVIHTLVEWDGLCLVGWCHEQGVNYGELSFCESSGVLNILVVQRRNLFGNDPDQEREQRRQDKYCTHIGKSSPVDECVAVIAQAGQ